MLLDFTADLLALSGRAPLRFNPETIGAAATSKVVLVTGAAGSIGKELCRAVLSRSPKKLILFDRSENDLFHLLQRLKRDGRSHACRAVLGDVCDPHAVTAALREHRPQVIFHAAAFKHVSFLESNAFEAIKNNLLGAFRLAEKAVEHGVLRFVMLSTDKAVNPVSVLGASKRMAELALSLLGGETRFTSVRFGNVFGSRGSVVPIFQESIDRRKPIVVTHREASRFFITSPEAVGLVLASAAIGSAGAVIVPDLGAPIKILELADLMVRRAGLVPGVDVPIVFGGLGPGEKLREEFFYAYERPTSSGISGVFRVAPPRLPGSEARALIDEAERAVAMRDLAGLLNLIKQVIPEYRESSTFLEIVNAGHDGLPAGRAGRAR